MKHMTTTLKHRYEEKRIQDLIEIIEIADFDYLVESHDLLVEQALLIEALSEEFEAASEILKDIDGIKGIPSIEAAVDKAREEILKLGGGSDNIKDYVVNSLKSLVRKGAQKLGIVESPVVKIQALANIIFNGVNALDRLCNTVVGKSPMKEKDKTFEQFAGNKKGNLLNAVTQAWMPNSEGFKGFMQGIGLQKLPYDLDPKKVASEIMKMKISDYNKMIDVANGIEENLENPADIAKKMKDAAEKKKKKGKKGKKGKDKGDKEVSKFSDVINDVAKQTDSNKKIVKMVFAKLNKMGKLSEGFWNQQYDNLLLETRPASSSSATTQRAPQTQMPPTQPGSPPTRRESPSSEAMKPQENKPEKKSVDKSTGTKVDASGLEKILKNRTSILDKIAVKLNKDPEELKDIAKYDEKKFSEFLEKLAQKKPKTTAWAKKTAEKINTKIDLMAKAVSKETKLDEPQVKKIIDAIPDKMLKLESTIVDDFNSLKEAYEYKMYLSNLYKSLC